MAPKINISREECESFLNAVPLSYKHEFEDKYCPGQLYYGYATEDPENFIKNVIFFSQTHPEDKYFQSAVLRYFGSEMVQNANQAGRYNTNSQRSGMNRTQEPEPTPQYNQYNNSAVKTKAKKRNVKTKITRTRSAADLKRKIYHKLFDCPKRQKRYVRLTQEERSFILKNVMLTKREQNIFALKCKGHPYWEIADELHYSEGTIKNDGAEIDKQIKLFLDEDSEFSQYGL